MTSQTKKDFIIEMLFIVNLTISKVFSYHMLNFRLACETPEQMERVVFAFCSLSSALINNDTLLNNNPLPVIPSADLRK